MAGMEVTTNDTWQIWSSSGEYTFTARTAGHAYLDFVTQQPDDFVLAIVNAEMSPRLVLDDSEPVDGIQLARVADVLTANHGCEDYDATAELASRLIRAYPDVRAAASVSLDRVTSELDHSVAAAMRHLADTGGF